MTLQINEPGSDGFYKEVVNVSWQMRGLLKKPSGRIKNQEARYILSAVESVLIIAVGTVFGVSRGFSGACVLFVVLGGVLLLMSTALLAAHRRAFLRMKNGFAPGEITLDENGVELRKDGKMTIRTAWGAVAFVREMRCGLCFVSNDPAGLHIFVENRYAEPILSYLRENLPEVLLVTQ